MKPTHVCRAQPRRTTTIASPPTYEDARHDGYHRLIDELELELIRRYGAGPGRLRSRLRHRACCCGRRPRWPAARWGWICRGGCWAPAHTRGLKVVQGSLTAVPLPDASFDLVYSMKVLAHVPPIREAVAELARLVRPGRPPAAGVLQPLVAALPGQAAGRARAASPPAPTRATSSPATTPWPRPAPTCPPTWSAWACAGCGW